METTKERWNRWNVLMNEKKYLQIVKEFDLLLHKQANLTIGDLLIRDEALEFMGVIPFSKEKAKKEEVKHELRRGKH